MNILIKSNSLNFIDIIIINSSTSKERVNLLEKREKGLQRYLGNLPQVEPIGFLVATGADRALF